MRPPRSFPRKPEWAGWAFLVAGLAANIIYLGVSKKPPSNTALAAGLRTEGNGLGSLFVTGLLAGLVTFGGAFTAVPYVYNSLVVVGKQMTAAQFLDGIAIVNIVPTPLVMFITWDGFVAGGISGAVLMTIGMFLPCFSFVCIFHRLFMYLTENTYFGAFIDGVSAAVIGIIAETVCELMKAAIHTGMDTLVFTVCVGVIFTYTNKNTPVYVLVAAAMAGQILYNAHSGNFLASPTPTRRPMLQHAVPPRGDCGGSQSSHPCLLQGPPPPHSSPSPPPLSAGPLGR